MAKDLPYFKFNVSEWNDGDITLCSLEAQGLFINLCSLYWSQEGKLSITKSKRRFKACNTTVWKELEHEKIIKIKGDNIVISFLDEQFKDREKLSETNKKNISKRWKGKKDTTVLPSNNNGKELVYNIEERREEESIYNDFGKGKTSFFIKAVYAGKVPDRVFELRQYFQTTGQLASFLEKGWTQFEAFQTENAGKVFNDPDHLYNTFRNFCIEYKPKLNGKNYSGAEVDKGLWTLEAWEKQYAYDLKNDNEFRKHFGYEEL